MKDYPRIMAAVFDEPWLITREKHRAIERILLSHIEGESRLYDDDEEDEGRRKRKGPELIIEDGTAIIPVHGIIGKHMSSLAMMSGGADLDGIGAMTEAAEADESVTRVLFDFRSPGGTVTGIPEMGRKIYRMKKKTVAFTDSEANSGAMWLASQAQEFYATQSSSVGSIGVWTHRLDYSRQLENEGVKVNAISAGKYKLMGAYWKPLTDEERGILQAKVDAIHKEFKAAVNTRRQVDEKYMEGQIFTGEEAARIGLIDGLVEDIAELFN